MFSAYNGWLNTQEKLFWKGWQLCRKGSRCRTLERFPLWDRIKGPRNLSKGPWISGKGPGMGSGGPIMVSCTGALEVLLTPLLPAISYPQVRREGDVVDTQYKYQDLVWATGWMLTCFWHNYLKLSFHFAFCFKLQYAIVASVGFMWSSDPGFDHLQV